MAKHTQTIPGRSDPQHEFSRAIGSVSRHWRQQMNQRLKPFGLNLSMRQVLMQLHRHSGGLMQRDLAELLSIEGPTLVRLLDFLEQKEWLTRTTAAGDKRRKFVALTANANAQIRIIERQSAELRRHMLCGLSDTEIQAGLALMRRLEQNLLQS